MPRHFLIPFQREVPQLPLTFFGIRHLFPSPYYSTMTLLHKCSVPFHTSTTILPKALHSSSLTLCTPALPPSRAVEVYPTWPNVSSFSPLSLPTWTLWIHFPLFLVLHVGLERERETKSNLEKGWEWLYVVCFPPRDRHLVFHLASRVATFSRIFSQIDIDMLWPPKAGLNTHMEGSLYSVPKHLPALQPSPHPLLSITLNYQINTKSW